MQKLTRMISVFTLWAMTMFFTTAAFATGPSAIALSVNKTTVAPGESLTVSFSVSPGLPNNAWIGIIPSNIPHGSEAVNDQHDLTYQHLQGRTRGTMTFTAPSAPGKYDLRMHNSDDNGLELGFVSFVVGGHQSQAVSVDNNDGPSIAANSQGATISTNKRVYRQGENIIVQFTAPAHYADDAWIGIIPAHIPHGSEAVNDQHDITYQHIRKRTSGEMIFVAPHPGKWDLRLHDTDNNGREITFVTFTVR